MTREPTLPTIDQLTPGFLTELLRAGPALTAGSVSSFEIIERKRAGAMGSVHSLRLRYTPGSRGERPERVVLKRTRPDIEFDSVEVVFYRDFAPKLAAGTTPICHGSVFCQDSKQYLLLLEDLSETHECLLGPGLPPIGVESVGILAECLARVHASWWERPLEGLGRRAADPARVTRKVMPGLAEAYPRLRSRLSGILSEKQDDLYLRYFEQRTHALLARLERGRAFAFLHGDAHVGNVLFPRAQGTGNALLIDWSAPRLGPAVWDLSFPLLWTAEECWTVANSSQGLSRYHAELLARGVSNYPFARCEEDFRHALLDNLRAPISQLAMGFIPDYVPRGAHTAAMALIDEWGCADLLR